MNDNASVEKALTYLGQCLSSKARDWFQTHVGPPRAADHGRSKAEYEQLLKDFKKCFHPMGKTTEQLEMAWANIKWNPTTESIEEFVSKIKQLATVLDKTQEDRDRDYRDSRSNRSDRSRGKNRKGYNGYNNRRSNHCAGCNCNQSCNNNQRSQNRGNSDGRRNSRGNTPCPHESIQSMQDSINLIMDESCNLLDLQDTYKDSLNF